MSLKLLISIILTAAPLFIVGNAYASVDEPKTMEQAIPEFSRLDSCMSGRSLNHSGQQTFMSGAWDGMNDDDLLKTIQDLRPDIILVGEDHSIHSARTTNGFMKKMKGVLEKFDLFFVEAPAQAFTIAQSLPQEISLPELVSQGWANGLPLTKLQKNAVVQAKFRIQNAAKHGLQPFPAESEWTWELNFNSSSSLKTVLEKAKSNGQTLPSDHLSRLTDEMDRIFALSSPGMAVRNCSMARRIFDGIKSNFQRGIFIVGASHLRPGQGVYTHQEMKFIQDYLVQAGLRVLIL